MNKSETVQEAWSEQCRGLFLYVDACNRQRACPEQKLLLMEHRQTVLIPLILKTQSRSDNNKADRLAVGM